MEIKKGVREWIDKIGLTKCIIIVLAGILLIVLSVPTTGLQQKENETKSTEAAENEKLVLDAMESYARKKEKETKEILEKVEGIGKVKVMITLSASEKRIALEDSDTTDNETKETDKNGGQREIGNIQSKSETVLVRKDGEDTPYVVQISSPEVAGVVVVAQGAGSSQIQAEIIDAIEALFSLEAHKIRVMKMK